MHNVIEEVASRSTQQGLKPTVKTSRKIYRKKKSVLGAQTSGSIRDIVEETRDEVPSNSKCESFNYSARFNL